MYLVFSCCQNGCLYRYDGLVQLEQSMVAQALCVKRYAMIAHTQCRVNGIYAHVV